MIKKYKLDELCILYKRIDGINEAFICEKLNDYYVDIFSSAIMNYNIGDYVEEMSRYSYARYMDSFLLLRKYNEINHIDFLKKIDKNKDYSHLDIFSDADTYNKWSYQFLKQYNLNKLFVIKHNDYIYICKYNPLLSKYIEIFSGKSFNNDSSTSLCDYLDNYGIKCVYKKLNMYSLLRLYHEINRINDFCLKDKDIMDIVLFELNMYGIYDDSKLYKQMNPDKRTTYKVLKRRITSR